LALVFLALASVSAAADAPASDDALMQSCADELAAALFGGAAHEPAMRIGQSVRHDGIEVLVHLDLASGEGRTISGTCRFRAGKLIDVRH
jgi:hypothetical protein